MMDTHDIATLSTVIICGSALIAFGDRLWKPKDRVEQSLQCGFQHKAFSDALYSQTEALKEMCGALRTLTSDAQLRHQIILDRLDAIKEQTRR